MSNLKVQNGLNGALGRPTAKRRPVRHATTPIRVLLVDGQALFREGMRNSLNRARGVKVVGEVGRLSDMAEMIARTQPDVVLTDFCLPDAADGAVLLELNGKFPGLRVVVLTALQGEECLLKALASGAHGFVLKDASCALVIKAVQATHAGETWVQRELIGQLTEQLRRTGTLAPQRDTAASLTQRQQDVLSLLAVGNSTAEIAKALFVSQSTVRVHLTRILGKLGLKNRIEAVRYAIKEGLVSL